MAWSAATVWSAAILRDAQGATPSPVRRDAQGATPSPSSLPRLKPDLLSVCEEGDNSVSIAVIDANALISFDSSARLLALAFSSSSGSPPRFVSVKEVLEEVRAPASRFHLTSLPCSIECIDPTDEALRKVVKFARETGDLHSLSDVDLKLLALTYMLEEQTYGSAHLRTQPPPIRVTQARHVRERDLPGWGTNVQNLEEWEQLSQEPDEAVNEGSHILGLKKLSLNVSELENTEEQKHAPQDASGNVHQEPNLHSSEGRNWHSPQGAFGREEDENALGFQDVNGFGQEDEVSNAAINLLEEAHGGEHSPTLLKDAEEEEVDQDVGEWQRSISRSTRRKHEKRAARAAARGLSMTKADVKSVEGKHVPTNNMDLGSIFKAADIPCPSNDQCSNSLGNEGSETGEAVGDELNNAGEQQDLSKSDEDCPSLCENFHADDEQPASLLETESEASWTLRPLSQSKVACLTADFPMQNVLLQMGLRVISPNGLQIQQIHRWALKCEACRNVTSDVGRMFCPKCGNGGTLYKVSIAIGPNGVVHTGTRRRTNLRGTKYSIPLPKGGRQGTAENPILREDQLPQKMLRPKKKASIPDFTSPAEIFAMKSGGKEKIQPPIREALAIFSGKRNPNHCRSKQRG